MLRKILASCLFLIWFPLGAFAISLDELKSNPSKYALVYDGHAVTAWVDVDSICVLRNEPPYVTIAADFYTALHKFNMIFKDNRNFNFDLNQRASLRLQKIEKEHPDYTEEEKNKELISLQYENPGIFMNSPGWELFRFNGYPYPEIDTVLAYLINRADRDWVRYHRISWEIANYVFAKCFESQYGRFGLPGEADPSESYKNFDLP